MNQILIQHTEITPELVFYTSECTLLLHGVSIPENPIHIFTEIEIQTQTIFSQCQTPKLHIKLEYFNTSSAKYLLKYLLKCISRFKPSITWICEAFDEDIIESGKDFEVLCGVPFTFKII
jgi:hypothetical protein